MKKIFTWNPPGFRGILFLIIVLIVILTETMGVSFAAKEDYVDRTNGKLDNIFAYSKEQRAREIVDNLYGDLNDDIKDVMDILSMDPDSNKEVWGMIQEISEALVTVGFTIASIFILLSFLNKAMMFQLRSYEDVAKILLFMLLAKVVLMSSFEILGFIYTAAADIIKTVGDPNKIAMEVNKEVMVKQIMDMNPLELLEFKISIMPVNTLMSIIKVLIKAIAYGRIFEIYIFTAVAPLPLSTLASPDQYSIAKKFIQSYIGVCLQGFIMILACVIFSALAIDLINPAGENRGSMGFLMASVVFLYVLVRSGSWGKQVVGLV